MQGVVKGVLSAPHRSDGDGQPRATMPFTAAT
jgi:hypothetical protein